MNPAARITYHSKLWPAACRGQGWNHRDQEKRRQVVLKCMREVRGPLVTTSDARFGADETTALFVYLAFLADQASLDKSAAWVDCKADYRAFNRARNADWHERETYGEQGSRKLQRDRFAKRRTAAGEPLDHLDREETRKRHITMAQRHREKLAKEKKAQAPRTREEILATIPPDRTVILLPAPADAAYEPDPEYVAPADAAF